MTTLDQSLGAIEPTAIRGIQVSVVICGPVETKTTEFPGTEELINNARIFFPGAEIVLSTWENYSQSASTLSGALDRLVLSPDPGEMQLIKTSGKSDETNFRRMVIAAYAGLQAATREYVMRLRADAILMGDGALKQYNPMQARPRRTEWLLFKQPVLIPCLYTRDPKRGGRVFHPSDLFQFGRREDVLELFGAALKSSYFKTRLEAHEGSALQAEQMLWISYLKSRGAPINLRRDYTWNPRLIVDSERYLMSNFLVRSFSDLDLDFKRNYESLSSPHNCYQRVSGETERPSLAIIVLLSWMHRVRDTFRDKLYPLIFDWSDPAVRWKKGLLAALWGRLGSR